MPTTLSAFVQMLLKAGAFVLIANEVRGAILAVPILFAMYEAGGTLMALWLGVSALGGIALSVIVPTMALRQLSAVHANR